MHKFHCTNINSKNRLDTQIHILRMGWTVLGVAIKSFWREHWSSLCILRVSMCHVAVNTHFYLYASHTLNAKRYLSPFYILERAFATVLHSIVYDGTHKIDNTAIHSIASCVSFKSQTQRARCHLLVTTIFSSINSPHAYENILYIF